MPVLTVEELARARADVDEMLAGEATVSIKGKALTGRNDLGEEQYDWSAAIGTAVAALIQVDSRIDRQRNVYIIDETGESFYSTHLIVVKHDQAVTKGNIVVDASTNEYLVLEIEAFRTHKELKTFLRENKV